jgi:hypothetical protein
MTPETEVILCPACRHAVRVPLDWLGTPVQCPECEAMFRAPARVDGALAEPELISRREAAPERRKKADVMLLLPAFGLMLVGFAGFAVGAWNSAQIVPDPDGFKRQIFDSLQEARKGGGLNEWGPADPKERARFDEDFAASLARAARVVIPLFAAVSGFVFYGGLAIALGRHYRMALLGCVLAVVNLGNLCCVPGAVVGVWGLILLLTTEGREHFGR